MKDEIMNVEVEKVEEAGSPAIEHEIKNEESSGPSKGFVACVVGGVAAIVGVGIIAARRHYNKAKLAEIEDDYIEEFDEDEPVEFTETEAESPEKSDKKEK